MIDDSRTLRVRMMDFGELCAVEFAGDIDLLNATQARLALQLSLARTPPPATVRLDLTDVEFMDSTGLIILLEARRDATARGSRLVVALMSATVARLLELSGLTEAFTGPPPDADPSPRVPDALDDATTERGKERSG